MRSLDSNRGKIVIGHHVCGDASPCADHCSDGTLHATCPLLSDEAALESGSSMCSFILVSTARTATFTAFLIARGEELPWQMMLTPRTPSNGAPPYEVESSGPSAASSAA